MYNFVFYFIYKSQVDRKNGDSTVAAIIATQIVFLFILNHILFLYTLIRFILFSFFDFEITLTIAKDARYSQKLILFVPVFIVSYILLYRYFSRGRISQLIDLYKAKDHFYTFLNFFKFFIIFFLPLVTGIILQRLSS
jgi:hypothetical protein